jgi:hypothetical protein
MAGKKSPRKAPFFIEETRFLALPDGLAPPTWATLRSALLAAAGSEGVESGDTFGPGDGCYAARIVFRPDQGSAILVGALVQACVTDQVSFDGLPDKPCAPILLIEVLLRPGAPPPGALLARLTTAAEAIGYARLPGAVSGWLRNVDNAHSEARDRIE